MARKIKYSTADFAVITDGTNSHVGAWSLCVGDCENSVSIGYSIETFLASLYDVGPVYMQDLNLAGLYILKWLDTCQIPFKLPSELHQKIHGEFYSCIRDASGTIYSITWQTGNKRVEVRNSRLKLVNNLSSLTKQLLGYSVKSDRTIQVSHVQDIDINSLADYTVSLYKILSWYLKNGRQLTISGDVLKDWMRRDKEKSLLYVGVELPQDIETFIRQAYRGGVCWTDPYVIDVNLGHGYVIDMHSIYLHVQKEYPMPYGVPRKVYQWSPEGLQWGRFLVSATLKEGCFPCISVCDGVNDITNRALDVIEDAVVILNKYDLELLYMNYDVQYLKYEYGYVFDTTNDVFKNFIEYWWSMKASHDNEESLRAIAKAFAVNSYGKFGLKQKIVYDRKQGKFIPKKDDNNKIVYNRSGFSYVPLAACITSIARYLIIKYAHKCKDAGGGRIVAIDTDAVHWIGESAPSFFKPSKQLGEFDIEAEFDCIRHIGIKQYAYQSQGHTEFILAGANDEVKDNLTWDTFHIGVTIPGKIVLKHTSQGAIRIALKYTLKGGI
ncbi:MAG: hypothetical protein HDR03_14950 [Lachnospiraceae bacterium]|nr:hypothetical protein [Lachnospiraceae bacterium]